jgi:Uncharacterised nucleotidyltransferase
VTTAEGKLATLIKIHSFAHHFGHTPACAKRSCVMGAISVSLLSDRTLSRETESGALAKPATVAVRTNDVEQTCSCGPSWIVKVGMPALTREQWILSTVLLSFCDPLPEQCLHLAQLSAAEWRKLLIWLDISGLALYFLDRLTEQELRDRMPAAVIGRLQQNLTDNTKRTRGMIDESVTVQRAFQEAGLSYAVMKGFSLCPESVPRPELRHQFDLDFRMAENSAPEARRILERRGYRLYAISGKSWEFKLNENPSGSMKDMYKETPSRLVELHLEATLQDQPSTLDRTVTRAFYGISMPVLSPVDLFLGQGLHAYKDVCSEFSRVAHLLEFRRHILARYDDDLFWRELQAFAEGNPRAYLGLGVVILLITHVMGDFAPEALTSWTVARLPVSVRLWVDRYGRRAVFKNIPGNKLYLLLQKELEAAGVPPRRSLKNSLFPSRLPPVIVRASVNESLSRRIARYRLQLRFILSRLQFHVVEGLRYAWESYRWRRQLNRTVL